jgi:hypothetical protein
MAADGADFDTQQCRYFLVLVTSRVQGDDVPLHFRQLADGSPNGLEFISALDLLIQRLFGNLLLADAGPGKLRFR